MSTIVKTPAGTWKALVRKQGWPTAIRTFRTRRDAEDWARQTEDEMVRGTFIRRAPSQKFTLAVALERYLREVTPGKKAGGSQRRDHTSAKALGKSLGTCSLAALNSEIIAKYRDARLAEGKSGSTVRLELALLSHLFTVALQEWNVGLPGNPVKQVRKPKTQARDRRLEGDEESRLLESVQQHGNPILAWVAELAIETAARKSEILSVRVGDVDLERRTAVLRDTRYRNETRTIPLTLRAMEIFREAIEAYPRDGTDLVFPGEPGRDGRRRPYTIDKAWQKALERVGLKRSLHFHDLRHEAASSLVEMGLSDAKVRQITGHRSAQMLYRYAHLRSEDLVRDLDAARKPRRAAGKISGAGLENPVEEVSPGAKIIAFPDRTRR